MTMATREAITCICRAQTRQTSRPRILRRQLLSRWASTRPESRASKQDLQDLEGSSSLVADIPSPDSPADYDPVKRAKARETELPASGYQYRSPRYYRGPLHPHQPPPTSDPASRAFVPGPFYSPRLQQTYTSTIAPDLMALMFRHQPPGTVTLPKSDRLRTWDDSSPYHAGRPKRGPRGPGGNLIPLEPDINWLNVPRIEGVTVHAFIKAATTDLAHLRVGGMVLQSLTGVKPETHRSKTSVAAWRLRARMRIALTSKLKGDAAIEFVDKLINLVMPRIKDWPGVKGSSGDSAGNITVGLSPDAVVHFPELQINYDMYPPPMIPGLHITVHTTAKSDRHARLLLKAIGMPFYGEYVD